MLGFKQMLLNQTETLTSLTNPSTGQKSEPWLPSQQQEAEFLSAQPPCALKRPPRAAEAVLSADMQRRSLRRRNGRKTRTLRKSPLDSNLPSACLLDPFLVLNYFLQTGAYKKKKTRIRHSCQSQKLSKLLPQNKLPELCLNEASPFRDPSTLQ